MKISELSERSGVPLPTIKFYIREGILPAGEHTAKNQADYTEEHLSRLALVRALKEDAGLPLATIASALHAADAARGHSFVVAAIDALERPSGVALDARAPELTKAHDDVLALAHELGWDVSDAGRSVSDAARALAVIRRSFARVDPRPYAEAVQKLAKHEIPDDWQPAAAPQAALHYAVLGTVLAEPLILALRRMAHVARSCEVEARARAGASRASKRRRAASGKPN
jgi:DNA-binding transcriptional MerR regulator